MIKCLEAQIINNNKTAVQTVTECKTIIDELKSSISQHETNEETLNSEVQDLKSRIGKSNDIVIRLNEKLTNIRSRYQAEKVAIQKDHKSYVKPLKKTIGKLTSKNIKLSKVKDATENVAKWKKSCESRHFQ